MNAIALLSSPGGRRKTPDPCLDFPRKIAISDKGGFVFEDFSLAQQSPLLENAFHQGAWDATPHTTSARKIALEGLVKGEPSKLLWEEQTPNYKRQIVHLESFWTTTVRYSGGVPLTPSVTWGALSQQKFPGEASLCDSPSLTEMHLDITRRLARCSGKPEHDLPVENSQKKPANPLLQTNSSDQGDKDGAGEGVEIPPPGIGIGYFAWLKEVIPGVDEQGPLGRGWGRIAEDKRSLYPTEGGRMDPGCVRIRGFVFATTEGHTVFTDEQESEVMKRGFRLLEIARFSTNLTVEDARSFKSFTLVRAAGVGVVLPSWILFPHGRAWLSDLRTYCPSMEGEPFKWILRGGVSRGLKTCSSFIVEPSQGFFRDDGGNPAITAKSFLGAISMSPYFSLGNERAPTLWRG